MTSLSLCPKIRIFFSADLVGSTALKQTPRFPLKDFDKIWEQSKALSAWSSVVSSFFTEFTEMAKDRWQNSLNKGDIFDSIPNVWKTNGDEIIFTKTIRCSEELLNIITTWKEIVVKYNEDVLEQPKGKLLIKSTIWLAGFPITNSEVVFFNGKEPEKLRGVSDLKQIYYLENWYINKPDSEYRKQTTIDYIGPQIDTGFRLCSLSSPHKIVVSLEIAYFLTVLGGEAKKIKNLKLGFMNVEHMKGVMGSSGYPVFYLDISSFDLLKLNEMELNNNINIIAPEKASIYIEEYYERHKNYLIKPFFEFEDKNKHSKKKIKPTFYEEALNFLEIKLDEAKTQYKAESNVNFKESHDYKDKVGKKIKTLVEDEELFQFLDEEDANQSPRFDP